ncbi:MAG TPA: hypothetical protein VER96_01665 [Polyangiaceae bacterium]|nr:hypothetical protein [Polyangiaceae bacterium]
MRGVRAILRQWRSSVCAALALCVACGGRSALRGRDLEATSGGSAPLAAVGGTLTTGAGGSAPSSLGGTSTSSGGTAGSGGNAGRAGQGGSAPVVLSAPDPQRTPPLFCSLDHWCGSNANFVAIWGSSATDIWVIANQTGDLAGSQQTNSIERSALLHWDGLRWGATQFDDTRALRAIWGSSKHDVYVVGANSTLLHYDGNSWSPVPLMLGASIDFTSVHGTSAKDVWVVGLGRAALHYDGSAWFTLTPPTMDVFRSVWSSADDVWVLGDASLNHFDRKAWSTVPRPAAGLQSAVLGHAPHEAWIGGPAGIIERWNAMGQIGGTSVDAQTGTANFRNLWGQADSNAWAVGEKGLIAHWGNSDWTIAPHLTDSNLNAAWGEGKSTWFVGDNGTFLEFDGQDWFASPLAAHELKRLWGSSANDVWAAGSEFMHWNGDHWQSVARPDGGDVFALWGSSATDVWAAGSNGLMLHWNGFTWELHESPTSGDIKGIWGSSNSNVWAVDSNGNFLHYDGIAWWISAAQNFGPLVSVWGRNASDVIAITASSRIRYDGVTWSLLPHHISESPTYKLAFGGGGAFVWLGGNVGWGAYKAGGARPELGRWDGSTMTDNLEPTMAPMPISLNYASVEAGWADKGDDVWIALPPVMHWDGAQWSYSPNGGMSPVAYLWGTSSDLWALTSNGQIINKSR